MGILLSVLCSYVGALELMFIVRDVTHQLALHQMRLRNEERKDSDISVLQNKIQASINALETVNIESVEQMQDGILYQNGYRIENERAAEEVAQQWEERRKVMCVAEVKTLESSPQSINRNGYGIGNGIQNERTKILNEYESTTENDESILSDVTPNDQDNYRPIVRDDRSGRRKAFKKRNSSSSQSGDSIRMSREEELKMFTSLEEEENKNSSFTPISYSNSPQSFHEKAKYDIEALSTKKPSSYHDSELWKRERATSIVEETEDNSPNTKHISSDKKSRIGGTADKPTRETSCENEKYASDACELLDKVETLCTLNTEDETLIEDNICHQQRAEPNSGIRKIDNLPNLNQYFNDAIESDTVATDKPCDFLDERQARDARSLTVYSRSDSENSHVYRKSISTDSCSTCNESITDYLQRGYNRTDSCNSFIQDELDSEEYHHNHRFSMTAEALEYIRGRDDWKVYTENKFNNSYRRQSSNICIREEIDSDEYHHDRKLSDLIEIAYLGSDVTQQSLPSSFEDNKVFDRYYFELQKIKGRLSNDIERNVAQKQVVLLDANEIQATEGYMYPLPHIILDQVDDHDDKCYAVEQLDSDYSNVSESEDDIQSVIEVNHDGTYNGEIITTLDMDGDDGEMIEVTLWDLIDDPNKEIFSKESSVEIIISPDEHEKIDEKGYAEESAETLHDEITNIKPHDSEFLENSLEEASYGYIQRTTPDVIPQVITSQNQTKRNLLAIDRSENIKIETVNGGVKEVNELKTASQSPQNNSVSSEEITESPLETENKLNCNTLGHRPSTIIETTASFIEHENLLPVQQAVTTRSSTHLVLQTSKTFGKEKATETRPPSPYENVDDLVQEGSMGVWFHK